MPVPSTVLRRLSATIKKFRFEELESSVIPIFPETPWVRIRLKLIKHHQSFTVTNALKMIEVAINEARLTEKVLQERLAILQITEVSRHPNKKVWYTFAMKGRKNEARSILSNHEIRSRIIENFRINLAEIDVRMITHDGITYISMRDKPKGKKEAKRLSSPIYFALFLGHEHFFCSKKNVANVCLDAVSDSLGYTSVKRVKLMGRELHSLIQMLWMKKQGAVSSNNFCETPEPETAEPIITSTGIDFRQHKRRREYVERCFGEEPPTLELLVATGPEQPWKDEEITMKMADEQVQIRWDFRSHNVATMLPTLAEYRIFAMPLPQYVSNLMKLGKNEIKLRETDESIEMK